MHELGILSAMLKSIEKIMEEENLHRVEKIVLQVGELSGVIPDYLEKCFPAAIYQTNFTDTQLEIEVIEGIVRCNNCQEQFNGYRHDLICPVCGKQDLEALSGRELLIKEILAG